MEGLVKTYATRLARKHVLQRVCAPGVNVLETEKQLLEMALSRLREGVLSAKDGLQEDTVATLIRREAAAFIEEYAESDSIREQVRAEVAALSDDEIFPRIH